MGTAHLMDILEGPAGYGAESILIRYQAPWCDGDDEPEEGDGDNNNNNNIMVEGDDQNPVAAAAAAVQQQPGGDDDTVTVKSTSTAGSASTMTMLVRQRRQTSHNLVLRRRRRQLQQQRRQQILDDQIWFVLQSLVRFANPDKGRRHLSLRFVGCRFPAPALAWFLNKTPSLERLQLRVTLDGSLTGLASALERHSHLRQVTLDHCRPSLPDISNHSDGSTDEDLDGSSTRRTNGGRRRRRTSNHRHQQPEESESHRRLDKSNASTAARKKTPPPALASLEPLLDGLAQSKTLKSLTLSHTTVAFTATSQLLPITHHLNTTKNMNWNAGASLSHFLRRSKSLTKLSLEHMAEIRDEDFATMMTALEEKEVAVDDGRTKSQLRTLSIRQCSVGPQAGQALGRMLATNTSLQTLDVNIHWWDGLSYHETTEGNYVAQCWETDVTALIAGLATNRDLQCLGLYCDNLAYSHSAAVVSLLGDAVEASVRQLCATALQALPSIFKTQPSLSATTSTASAIPKQQEENRSLEDIIVGHRSFGLTSEIDFYLNWNRAGRDYYCSTENTSSEDWIDTMLNHRGDLSVVYALLSTNPTIIQT